MIVVVTDVAAPAQVLHDLVLDVDVHAESLRASGESATTSTGRRVLGRGDEVTFRARHLGVRWTMTSRVTTVERPHRVVDEQVRGPFRRLRHEHLFTPGPRGTRMTDRMEVALPGGPSALSPCDWWPSRTCAGCCGSAPTTCGRSPRGDRRRDGLGLRARRDDDPSPGGRARGRDARRTVTACSPCCAACWTTTRPPRG